MSKETAHPNFFRRTYAAISFATVSALAACSESAVKPVEPNNSPTNSSSSSQLLDSAFPDDPDMKIQQGFIYENGTTHKGIDFIKGQLDKDSTWKPFPVLSPVDGMACEPTEKIGNAIFIHSLVNDRQVRVYLGHLEDQPKLSSCASDPRNYSEIKKGQFISNAGASGAGIGTEGFPLTHLHEQTNDENDNPFDFYGLSGKRSIYPNPQFDNGKTCGQDAILAACYKKQVNIGPMIALPKPPLPIQVDQIIAAKVEPGFPFPFWDTWYFVGGGGHSNADHLLFAPPIETKCSPGLVFPDWLVRTSLDGTIRSIDNNTVIENIEGGFFLYENVKPNIRPGQKVKTGDPLGTVTCSPKSKLNLPYIDFSYRNPVGISFPFGDDRYISGWINNPKTLDTGILQFYRLGQEPRMAIPAFCPPEKANNPICNGFRNDLTSPFKTSS